MGSFIDYNNISKFDPLADSSYIKLPKKFQYPRKSLINIQITDDNVCLKWYLLRYLNHENHNPARTSKDYKILQRILILRIYKFQ